MVYNNLVDHQVKLPLQLYQQHFHLMKPQKFTQPDQHVAYVFTLARKKNMVILCDWGEKVLKDLIQAGVSTNYTSKRYIGCGSVITRILYHALGMTDQLVEVADEEQPFWEELGERREAAQRETRSQAKATKHISSDKDEPKKDQEPPEVAGSSAPPATAQEGQKLKIKIKVQLEEKEGVPSEYKSDENEAFKRKKEIPPKIPKQRKKEKSHRERAVPINQEKEIGRAHV